MNTLNSGFNLKETILQLELKQALELKLLRQQLHLTYESIKPINLVKNTFKEVVASEDLTDNIVNTSVGLAAGYVSKTLFEKASHSPFRKLLGTALLFGVTNLVSKNPQTIKAVGLGVIDIIKHKLSNRKHHTNYN
jgi:hypothetical protein